MRRNGRAAVSWRPVIFGRCQPEHEDGNETFIIRLAAPTRVISITANMSNFGALFFPFVLIYLNTKLPKAARPPFYTKVLLVLNFLFFGFFFVNFVFDTFLGGALITF